MTVSFLANVLVRLFGDRRFVHDGTAEPFRVSPPEAVACPFELTLNPTLDDTGGLLPG